MDMRNEFHQWLYEEVAVLKEGRVYLVKNRQNGMLAVKKLLPASLRPIYEAVAEMKSPVLPRILSVQELGDAVWVLEEYVSGRSLRSILEVGRTLDNKETMVLAKDLCEALECLHGAKPPIIHRDVKPDNIILSDLGRYVLIDFDAARQYSSAARKDTLQLGTQGYAPPEQYGFGQSDMRSDIYALGVTLYEARTGKPYEKMERCGGKLWALIDKCTNLDVKKRYQSVKSLQRALQRLARKERIWAGLGSFLMGAIAAAAIFCLVLLPRAENAGAPVSVPVQTPASEQLPPQESAAPAQESAAPGAAAAAITCTCTLPIVQGEKDAFAFSPHYVNGYEEGTSLEIPIELYWRVDDSECKAEVHDEPEVQLKFTQWKDSGTGATGETLGDVTLKDNLLTVYEPGDYRIEARSSYHGNNSKLGFWIRVVPKAEDVRNVCCCELIFEDGDERLHGWPLAEFPFSVFEPASNEFSQLPAARQIHIELPVDDWGCWCMEHTPQRWAYTLQETKGASIEGDMLTVTMPGEYHICYEGEYNGREYSGIYTLQVP